MEVAPTTLWKMKITHTENHDRQDSAMNRPTGLGRGLARKQGKGKARPICSDF